MTTGTGGNASARPLADAEMADAEMWLADKSETASLAMDPWRKRGKPQQLWSVACHTPCD